MGEHRKRLCLLVVLMCVMAASQVSGQSGKPPVVPPKIIKLVKPDCSAGRDCHGLHGSVELTVNVLTDGTVGDVKVTSGDPRLTEAAVKAAKLSRFEPGTFAGEPTSMNYDLKYKF
jgi:TonB family protein